MKRNIFIFVMVFFIIGLGFSQTNADDDFSPLDAYYLGRAVAANILNTYKLYNNPDATQYVNKICQALVINSGSTAAAYKGYFVMIIDSKDFNAFATPGGHIFVTKKLVESATSEDMLAAVIAHELSHIMLKHGIAIINEFKVENELSSVADWAASTAAKMNPEAARAAGFRDSISKTVDVLMTSGYSQQQEFDADLEAVILLAKAGYDPNALVDILKVMQNDKGPHNSGFYSTHPSPEQRIANLDVLNLKSRKNDTLRYRVPRFKKVKF